MIRFITRLVNLHYAIEDTKQKIHAIYKSFVSTRWRTAARWIWGITFISGVLWWQFQFSAPPLTVYFYDVGQGDAIHIRNAQGFDVLIDGGPTGRVVEKLGRTLPFWDRTIELMVLTHPHADHVVGLIAVLRRFKVQRVLVTGVLHTTDEYLTWLQEIKNQDIPITIAQQGQQWEIGDGALDILRPRNSFDGQIVSEGKLGEGGGLNDTSIVTRLTFGKIRFLFMGDATSKVETELLKENARADVLKVGHHGSKYSTSREFLKVVQPRWAVIQVGKNRYGHPAFATLWRLQQARIEILRNDEDGDVVFETDGLDVKRRP